MASGMYGSDPRLARDEAIRSGSLAAMTLMLVAGNRGYASCPIGFNPVQVMEILTIAFGAQDGCAGKRLVRSALLLRVECPLLGVKQADIRRRRLNVCF
jgi:nitroreductase